MNRYMTMGEMADFMNSQYGLSEFAKKEKSLTRMQKLRGKLSNAKNRLRRKKAEKPPSKLQRALNNKYVGRTTKGKLARLAGLGAVGAGAVGAYGVAKKGMKAYRIGAAGGRLNANPRLYGPGA